jgi:ubiquinone/menaquinone biosynthesis C-methylase UbiE
MSIFKPFSAERNKRFYNKIIQGRCKNYIWGKEKRFSPEKVFASSSVRKNFKPILAEEISASYRVLDLGCGSGMFLPIVAPMCEEIVGVDISSDMLTFCSQCITKYSIENASLSSANSDHLPFVHETFDAVYMVDVIHHVVDCQQAVKEIYRVLKPGGRFIVFEPNKFNMLLAIFCFLDRNEWGALRLGSKRQYRKLFKDFFDIKQIDYNGLLIGPDSKLNCIITDFLDLPVIKFVLGWQSPKISILMTKKNA